MVTLKVFAKQIPTQEVVIAPAPAPVVKTKAKAVVVETAAPTGTAPKFRKISKTGMWVAAMWQGATMAELNTILGADPDDRKRFHRELSWLRTHGHTVTVTDADSDNPHAKLNEEPTWSGK
jgi:hypothetical protein